MAWMMPAAMLASAAISKFGSGGGRDKMKKLPTMAPNQMNQFNQAVDNPIQNNPIYQSGGSYLQKILSGDPSAFEAFENPYIENFQQKILPMIGERFAGAGSGSGALNSSAFQQTLGQAGRGLQTDLAGLRAGLQQNAAQMALPYAQQPYNNAFTQSQIPTFAYAHQPQGQSALSGFGGPLMQGIGQGFGAGPLSNWMSQFFNQSNPINSLQGAFGQQFRGNSGVGAQ